MDYIEIKRMEEIKNSYGFFLEHIHPLLSAFFLTDIPESFLPYKKKVIETALEKIEKHLGEKGDVKSAELFSFVRSFLLFYVNDDQAIDSLMNREEAIKKASIPLLKKIQKDY